MTFLAANPLLVGFIILTLATLALFGLVIWMWLKLRRFLIGIDAASIKDSLAFVGNSLDDLQKFRADMDEYRKTVEQRLKKSVQAVHTVRFNPFHGEGFGGNQSFATAFLTEDGDGVIISSLYSRDRVSIFSKPVKNRASEHELSDEEKEALEKAVQNLG
ncbi:MAG: DUF4446 family protein [Patescibacteria group bacterium]|nr:DUF4446 family protein [Patescibacteria group bacterium]MDE2172728.1 DUF4446 family protein [Patescibacteria group bacterium]